MLIKASDAASLDSLAAAFNGLSEQLHGDAKRWDEWAPPARKNILAKLIERGLQETEAELLARMLEAALTNAAQHARDASQEIYDVCLTVDHILDEANRRVSGDVPKVTTLKTGV
jgi:hypothetical protein